MGPLQCAVGEHLPPRHCATHPKHLGNSTGHNAPGHSQSRWQRPRMDRRHRQRRNGAHARGELGRDNQRQLGRLCSLGQRTRSTTANIRHRIPLRSPCTPDRAIEAIDASACCATRFAFTRFPVVYHSDSHCSIRGRPFTEAPRGRTLRSED